MLQIDPIIEIKRLNILYIECLCSYLLLYKMQKDANYKYKYIYLEK
jgi:hypothetical protein